MIVGGATASAGEHFIILLYADIVAQFACFVNRTNVLVSAHGRKIFG
jgi:hypothetical protein